MFLFFLSPVVVHAQEENQLGVFDSIVISGLKNLVGCTPSIQNKVNGEIGLEQWVAGKCSETSDQSSSLKDPGVIPLASNMIGQMLENKPVSSITYLADVSQNLGFAKPAFAQGTGYKALEPVLEVWKAFRNVAFLLMVIILVVIGFMIMFRRQINPQTVVSIQNALPNIAVTLLLIYFSYAIAGLMIDLIYVTIYLIIGIFAFSGVLTDGGEAARQLLLTNGLFGLVYSGSNIFARAPSMAMEDLVNGLFGKGFTGDILSSGVEFLMQLIFSIALLFAMFKLFFILLLSYLNIVLSVIFAPLQLLFNAFPGSNSFSGWLKNLFANVAVFPITACMFLLAAILIGVDPSSPNAWGVKEGIGFIGQRGEPGWSPPFIGGSGTTTSSFMGLIALGMIMMMPQIASKIKEMLKAEGLPVGGAVVGGMMSGPRLITGGVSGIMGLASQGGYMVMGASKISELMQARKNRGAGGGSGGEKTP